VEARNALHQMRCGMVLIVSGEAYE
jgi:hypothetical protein